MNWLRGLGRALLATFRDGTRLLWLAPLIALFAGLTEFAQHVGEIELGMFASPAAFKALQNNPLRWNFGYAKFAGLFLTIFAAARYWSLPEGTRQRWWDPRTVAWRPFLIGVALNGAVSAAAFLFKPALSAAAFQAVNIALSLATLPLLVYMFGGLFGDRAVRLGEVYRTGWLRAPAMALCFLVAMVPAQLLHRFNHIAAMGAPEAMVWALMVWDALLVALMACWAGTGLAAGYAIAPAPRKIVPPAA